MAFRVRFIASGGSGGNTNTFTGTTNTSVGFVASNTTFSDATFSEMMNAIFVSTFISSLSTNLPSSAEHGDSVSTTSATINIATPSGATADSLALTFIDTDSSQTSIFTGRAINSSQPQTETFSANSVTLLIQSGQSVDSALYRASVGTSSGTKTASDSCIVKFRVFFGADVDYTSSNIAANIDTLVSNLESSALRGSEAETTFTCTSENASISNRTYIVYPAVYGDLEDISFQGEFSVKDSFTDLTDSNGVPRTTNGQSVNYRVLKSTTFGAYLSGQSLILQY
jgi:hypothetical protein